MYVFSFISRILHNFSMGIFSMYWGILELNNDTSILRRNGSFTNKTCCDLTALFAKTNIFHCNFANKQINKNSLYCFFGQIVVSRLWSIGRTQNLPKSCSFGNGTQINGTYWKCPWIIWQIDKLFSKTKYIIK